MIKFKYLHVLAAIIIFQFLSNCANACSMYKITVDNKTVVGTNFDAYYLTLRIWFENAATSAGYGAAFTGGRFDGSNGFAPQSGMNEYGLAFSRLAAPPPEKEISVTSGKKTITNPTKYLKDILHTCKNIEEVKHFISAYDHSFFIEDVFIYIEKSGRYLIVESDTMTVGNNVNYVLSNFCPSTTKETDALKLNRYRNGVAFVKNKANTNTTTAFYTELSDTMHVCRKKVGDGTLLTSIWNLNDGVTHLYFYHDYKHVVQFNLKDELAKGDHMLEIQALFPPNAEFEKLINFKIPQNNMAMMLFLFFSGILFFISSLFFLVSFLRTGNRTKYSYLKLALFPLGITMFYYMYVLARNMYIFYFPAPYKDYKFSMLNIAAYIPFLILLLIIPLLRANIKVFKENAWRAFSKWLFTLNNLTYLVLIILFCYWGLFNIFG